MFKENTSQEFKHKNMDETRKYSIKQLDQNETMSKKHKTVCWVLNYIENLLILIATLTGSVSISAFASLVFIPIGITSSAIGLNFCVIRIKEYKSISKKKKKQDKNSIINKNLISKALIDSNISLNQFVLINNSLKEFYDMLEEIKNSNDK